MTTTLQLVPYKEASAGIKEETLKWMCGNTRYECQLRTLDSLDLQELIPHCLRVKSKIDFAVGNNAHRGQSYFKVFPRMLSMMLEPVRNHLMEEARTDNDVDDAETEANFDLHLKEFIAVHSTSSDHHEWLQSLQTETKPREMGVQKFWYRLIDINKQIEWLPGFEPVLTDDQIKQAFYNAMPVTWRDRYVHSGKVFQESKMAEVAQYFRSQENNANQKQQENNKFQKRSHHDGHCHQNGKSKYGKNNPSKTNNGKDQKSNDQDKEKKVSFNSSTKRSRISDDAPCPIHPGAGHKWSQCRSNAYNKDRQVKKANPTTTKNEAQSHAATAAGSKVEVHATTCNDPDDTLYSNGTFTPDSYFNYTSLTLCTHHLDECFLVEQVLPDP
jgi:hypothetical protein